MSHHVSPKMSRCHVCCLLFAFQLKVKLISAVMFTVMFAVQLKVKFISAVMYAVLFAVFISAAQKCYFKNVSSKISRFKCLTEEEKNYFTSTYIAIQKDGFDDQKNDHPLQRISWKNNE